MSKAIVSVLVVVVAAVLAGGASASARSTTAQASFCGTSKNVAKSLVSLASGLTASASDASHAAVLKSQLQLVKRSEHSLKSHVPKKLKRPLGTALAFVDFAYTKLSAIKWNIANLITQPSTAAALEAAANRAGPSFDTLRLYYRKTCHFAV